MNRILEKTRVVITDSSGEWKFEEMIDRSENVGEKYVIIENNNNKNTKNINIKSDYLLEISISSVRYDVGDTVNITGSAEPAKNTTILVKDQSNKIVHYDVFSSQSNGNLTYEFQIEDEISIGTYVAILKQENGADASLFGVVKYPTPSIVTLMEKTNFGLNSKAVLNIIGPASSNLAVKVLDSNDNIELTDSVLTSSSGKSKYAIDLEGLSSGIYKAVVSSTNIQDSVKFSVGLEPGSGAISLISTQENYSPGQSILVLGTTGSDARLTITLYEPSGKVSSATETFSDGSGNFATSEIGIPVNAELGTWKLTAHSRLDTKSIDINITVPTEKGITIELVDTEFDSGQTMTIKGIAKSDDSRIDIEIADENDTIIAILETPITADGSFSVPWVIPSSLEIGMYTITVSDADNSDTVTVFIN